LKSGIKETHLRAYYETLFHAWGHQHWWPARSRFEVIVGAYLTQNTSWTNVELALRSLRKAHLLIIDGIRKVPLPELELLIRSAGYFRQKARRLKTFVAFLDEKYAGSLRRMFAQPTEKLREELLALNGIGPETADSILLYAGQHPVFVVDAYTRRILDRHNILPANVPYEEIRALFERALEQTAWGPPPPAVQPGRIPAASLPRINSAVRGPAHPPSRMSLARRSSQCQVFNDMHGLIVAVGKHYCSKSHPKCDECPLQKFLPPLK
jgi:endonuclease III related protein